MAVAALVLSGCAIPPSAMFGMIVLDVKQPLHVSDNQPLGPKKGTACQDSILGWVTRGDSSLEAAVKDGGITRINHVDFHSESTLGVVGKWCVIVHGS